ncbi:hypothetical protein BV25DRAFT_1640893 [Artomyces pyxidatus]|uniref:Uncharacterized protein n=1 Tax=Artomyces pyxidatus TaxID=48021 RepID=A0ACB8SIJ3_9AGAM|nr:hypothetical protein BV25DRAFT_1640893 [Artomyces pyxidatus]
MCSDTSRGASTICQYPTCDKNVWRDPDGSFSSYCGMTHRLAMANISPAAMCKVSRLWDSVDGSDGVGSFDVSA